MNNRMRKELEELISNIYEKNDILAFREYLTSQEDREFMHEDEKISIQRLELIKKYNKVASDRISRGVLLKEIRALVGYHDKLDALLEAMDNKSLQSQLSLLQLKKERKESNEK